MIHKVIGALAASLLLAGGLASAQTSEPGADQPQLSPASGVGGCIYRRLPPSVSRDALTAIMSHGDIRSVLRGPVAQIAPGCTGRPFSDTDGAVVGSIFSVYSRMVAAYALGQRLQLPQHQLDEMWGAATPEEKAPFLASAQTFISPGHTFVSAKPEAVEPFVQRLGLSTQTDDPNVPKLLYMYFSATALNELAEADLAARGSPSGAPR